MLIQPISNDMSQPYRSQTYLKTKRKRIVDLRANCKLTQDTIEISKEGMELYLKERLQMKRVYQRLLITIEDGNSVLTATKIHEDIPTIHTIAGKYHSSVNHIGFGVFVGKTENGEFSFCGGGAMNRETLSDGSYFGWCCLSASEKVLKDLNYDSIKVLNALNTLIKGDASC